MKRTIKYYRVAWDNGHASGVFSTPYFSLKEAEAAAREWHRDMVSIEEPEHRKIAREIYSWEILHYYLEIERVYAWPGHYWTARLPGGQIIAKECPYRHLIPSAYEWLRKNSKP